MLSSLDLLGLGGLFAAWLAFTGITYAIFYGARYGGRFKFNPQYPSSGLVVKEVRRSVVSLLVCWVIDSLLAPYYIDGDGSLLYVVPLVLWVDFHFYWTHRALHEVPFLYTFHKVHHESYNTDTFSGLSFHPVEAAVYFSSLVIGTMLPVPRWMMSVYKYGLVLGPIPGHNAHGPAEGRGGMYPVLFEDHWIHHAKFNYNFGSGLLPRNGIWDNLLGTAYRPNDTSRLAAAKAQEAVALGRTAS